MNMITKIRKEKGWSKTRLGIESGIHPATIGKIEAGLVLLYPGWRKAISKALEVDEKELSKE